MDADGTNKTRLLDESWGLNDDARFTPNGRILFTSSRVSPHSNKMDGGNVWLMNADGTNKMIVVPVNFPSNYTAGDFSTSPSMNADNKTILFRHGLYTHCLYYVTDPTGQWKDSDGDGVWDGIDGAPNDPNAGYITGDESRPLFSGTPVLVPLLAIICIVAAFEKWKKRA